MSASTHYMEYLDTAGLIEAERKLKEATEVFNELSRKMRGTTRALLSSWDGKGRVEFETQSDLMVLKLEDLSEALTDAYEALVSAEKTYINADEETAKAISMNS